MRAVVRFLLTIAAFVVFLYLHFLWLPRTDPGVWSRPWFWDHVPELLAIAVVLALVPLAISIRGVRTVIDWIRRRRRGGRGADR